MKLLWGAVGGRRTWGWIGPLAAALCFSATTAYAEGPEADGRATPRVIRLTGNGGTLQELAKAAATLDVGEPSVVVVSPVLVPGHLEGQLPKGALESLRQKLRENVAAAIPLAKIQVAEALSAQEARTRARREGLPLVLISASIQSSDLALTITVTKWPDKFWHRVANAQGSTTSQLHIRAFSESIRHVFPAAKGIATQTDRWPSPVASPIALACGNLDDQGAQQLLVVGRHTLHLGKLDGGSFEPRERRAWADLTPIHGSPLRAPLGNATFAAGKMIVGSSDRAATVHLDEDMKLLGYSPRGYPIGKGECLPFSASGLVEPPFDCAAPNLRAPTPSAPPLPSSPKDWGVYARSQLPTPSGAVGSMTATAVVGATEAEFDVKLPAEAGIELKLAEVGSTLLIADLDGDGHVEVIASAASGSGTKDELRIFSLQERELKPVAAVEMEPISAATVCPFDGMNPLTLVVATEKDLWIIR